MAEIVNLRMARKRARRKAEEARAEDRRLAHGMPKAVKSQAEAERTGAARKLDGHRLERSDPCDSGGPRQP